MNCKKLIDALIGFENFSRVQNIFLMWAHGHFMVGIPILYWRERSVTIIVTIELAKCDAELSLVSSEAK